MTGMTFALRALMLLVLTTCTSTGSYPVPTVPVMSDDDASDLTLTERTTISNHIKKCWKYDGDGSLEMVVLLLVTTDSDGVARHVKLAPHDEVRARSDQRLMAFAEQAERTVMDSRCAALPLPSRMLGKG